MVLLECELLWYHGGALSHLSLYPNLLFLCPGMYLSISGIFIDLSLASILYNPVLSIRDIFILFIPLSLNYQSSHYSSYCIFLSVQIIFLKLYCSGHQEPEYSRGRLCKALGSWGSGNLEGRGGYIGKGWVYKEGEGQDGSVISNLGPEWTFLSQLEGAK